MFLNDILYLNPKFNEVIKNKWVHWVVIILVILALSAYAFYCTSKGYNFGWNIDFSRGNFIQMGVRCLR